MKRNFLVVASSAKAREALAGDLRAKGYSVTRAVNGGEAEQIVRTVAIDAVLTEATLPDMSGEDLVQRVKKARPDCRTVVLTSFEKVRNTTEQLRFGEDDYLLRASEIVALLHAPYVAGRDISTPAQSHRETGALTQVIDVLVGLLELDERFFGGFSHQAMGLARGVAQELNADDETVQEVVIATLLRDIGKVGVDPQILSEEGRFTEEQKEKMNSHVESTLRLLAHIDFPWKVIPVVRHHHERYDGKGYPDGLRGPEIPMGARIVAVVDAYVALTSGRSHRGAFDAEQALMLLVSEAGRQFDPEVIEAFQAVLDKRRGRVGAKRKPHVLIADPQDDSRKLLKMRLLNDGCEVSEAGDFELAMGLLLKGSPDLVLADLDADNDVAFRFLEELREANTLRRVPFAFLSRSSDRVLMLRALREGVDEFLDKDLDIEELAARVHNVITREGMRRDSRRRKIRRGITGDLENLGLPEIVQTLVMGMKTACVTLRSKRRKGRIWFANGEAKHAEAPGLEGEGAFFEMVGWDKGEFVIEHGSTCDEESLAADAMYLLMEGLRLIDEARDDGAKAAS